MVKEYSKGIVKKLVKAYLLFHKGKEVTANEIANWINDPENNFGLKTHIDSKAVGRMITSSRWDKSNILYGIEIKKNRHPYKYVLH